MEAYTDGQTGIRFTVERDGPYQKEPRVTAYPPVNCTLSTEEVSGALRRLIVTAGLTRPGQAPPQGGKL